MESQTSASWAGRGRTRCREYSRSPWPATRPMIWLDSPAISAALPTS